MIDRTELDVRLRGWADEYGGGKYEHVGWHSRNLLQTLVEHRGFVPSSRGFVPIPIRSAADEVERVVRAMEASGSRRQACVLRCDFFSPNLHLEERMRRLRTVGVSVCRTTYYALLAQAKGEVAEALTRRAAA